MSEQDNPLRPVPRPLQDQVATASQHLELVLLQPQNQKTEAGKLLTIGEELLPLTPLEKNLAAMLYEEGHVIKSQIEKLLALKLPIPYPKGFIIAGDHDTELEIMLKSAAIQLGHIPVLRVNPLEDEIFYSLRQKTGITRTLEDTFAKAKGLSDIGEYPGCIIVLEALEEVFGLDRDADFDLVYNKLQAEVSALPQHDVVFIGITHNPDNLNGSMSKLLKEPLKFKTPEPERLAIVIERLLSNGKTQEEKRQAYGDIDFRKIEELLKNKGFNMQDIYTITTDIFMFQNANGRIAMEDVRNIIHKRTPPSKFVGYDTTHTRRS